MPTEQDDSLHYLTKRISRLEATTNRHRRWVYVLSAYCCFLTVSGPVILALLRAEGRNMLFQSSIDGKAGTGRSYVELWSTDIRSAGLLFRDSQGRDRGGLSVFRDNPIFGLIDPNGKTRISAGFMEADKTPRVCIFDKNELSRAALYLQPDDTPRLSFFDQKQRCRLVLALEANGWPTLSVFDDKENCRFVFSGNDGMPQAYLWDSNNERWATYSLDNDIKNGVLFKHKPNDATTNPSSP
ncbi:MAG: hypothetical protein HZA51_10375 [Planctomycetes bacterium]|nr:hypothetical protein [Planctomycetota bacterium]